MTQEKQELSLRFKKILSSADVYNSDLEQDIRSFLKSLQEKLIFQSSIDIDLNQRVSRLIENKNHNRYHEICNDLKQVLSHCENKLIDSEHDLESKFQELLKLSETTNSWSMAQTHSDVKIFLNSLENKIFWDLDFDLVLEQPVFQHEFGSRLLECHREQSDLDVMKFYTCSKKPKLYQDGHSVDNILTTVSNDSNGLVEETLNLTLVQILKPMLLGPDDIITTNKIIYHLAAMKFEKIEKIYQPEIFQQYLTYLKSAGKSVVFWLAAKNILYKELASLPDQDFNWPVAPNQSAETQQAFQLFKETGNPRYPAVEGCGYDPIMSRKLFQSLFLATNILNNHSEMISQDQRQLLIKLTYGHIPLDQYKDLKKSVWRQFRQATESLGHLYFLGQGYDLQQTVEHGFYGQQGDKKILDLFRI